MSFENYILYRRSAARSHVYATSLSYIIAQSLSTQQQIKDHRLTLFDPIYHHLSERKLFAIRSSQSQEGAETPLSGRRRMSTGTDDMIVPCNSVEAPVTFSEEGADEKTEIDLMKSNTLADPIQQSEKYDATIEVCKLIPMAVLSKLLSNDNKWFIVFLAFMENNSLSCSIHVPTYYRTPSNRYPYVYANMRHEALCGCSRRNLVNKSIRCVVHASQAKMITSSKRTTELHQKGEPMFKVTDTSVCPFTPANESVINRFLNDMEKMECGVCAILNFQCLVTPNNVPVLEEPSVYESEKSTSAMTKNMILCMKPLYSEDRTKLLYYIAIHEEV